MGSTAYYEDTYRFSDKAVVESSGKDEKGYYVVLEKTLFYPQGGGQPSDTGYLIYNEKEIPLHSVKMVNKQIRHYTNRECAEIVGHSVILQIDQNSRMLHSKLHTGGHLISNAVERVYQDCKAVKGHHFPGECYVEFIVKANKKTPELDIALLNQKINELINQNLLLQKTNVSPRQLATLCPDLPYSIPPGESIRLIKISSFEYQPCGGTHINSLSELKGLQLIKYKIKDNRIKIYYTI
jgi:Ser-tRNA(Ala) deacylase AlaX